jgi:hypothetical protein
MGTDTGGNIAAVSALARAVPNAPSTMPKQIVSATKNFFPIRAIPLFLGKPPAVYLRQANPAANKILHGFCKKWHIILGFNFSEKEVTFLKKSNQKTFDPFGF